MAGPAPARLAATLCFVLLIGGSAEAQLVTSFDAGHALEGAIASPGQVDAWDFDAIAGSLITITIKGKAGLLPDLALVERPSLAPVALGAQLKGVGKSKVQLAKLSIPDTGPYRLLIGGGAGTVGSYRAKTKVLFPTALEKVDVEPELMSGGTQLLSFQAAAGATVKGQFWAAKGSAAVPTPTRMLTPSGWVDLAGQNEVKKSKIVLGPLAVETAGGHSIEVVNQGGSGAIKAKIRVKPPKPAKGQVSELGADGIQSLGAYPLAVVFDAAGAVQQLKVVAVSGAAVFDLTASPGVSYASSDEGVVTVSGEGRATAVADGRAVISVSVGDASSEVSVEVASVPRLLKTSPHAGEAGVALTRESVLRFSSPIDESTIAGALSASAGSGALDHQQHLSADGLTLTLFYDEMLPPSSSISVLVDGDALLDELGRAVDVDQDGLPGGLLKLVFSTLSITPVAGTVVCGRVFASELDGELNVPLQGVTLSVDGGGPGLTVVTDIQGNFKLDPAPAGTFFVHVDGTTAVGTPPGGFYPSVGKPWTSVAGVESNLGEIYLPFVTLDALAPVSAVMETEIGFPASVLDAHPEWAGVGVVVPPNSLFASDGTLGGKVGIAPVDPERLPGELPAGLDFPLVITVQTQGDGQKPTNFDLPVPARFPNLPDPVTGQVLAPGERSALWSFDHDAGAWRVAGPMTVTPDGTFLVSDPGTGILAPGWHGTIPGTLLEWLGLLEPSVEGPCGNPFYEDLAYPDLPPELIADLEAAGHQIQSPSGEECWLYDVACAVSLDYHATTFQLPPGFDPGDLVGAIMQDINGFVDAPGPVSNFFEFANQFSWVPPADPQSLAVGDIAAIAISNFLSPDFGSYTAEAAWVVVSELDLDSPTNPHWVFTTITYAGNTHPVSGSREFGIQVLGNGQYTLYTKGVDSPRNSLVGTLGTIVQWAGWESFISAAGERLEQDYGAIVLDEASDVSFVQSLPDCEGIAPPVAVEPVFPDRTHYAVLYIPANKSDPIPEVLRGQSSGPSGSARLPGGAPYQLIGYDPDSKLIGIAAGLSAADGSSETQQLPFQFMDTQDTDGDGLGDMAEFVVGTDPENWDTDGDGVSDGAEVVAGSNPSDGIVVQAGIIASIDVDGLVRDVAASGNLAVAAAGSYGAFLFNVFNGMEPLLVAQLDGSVVETVAIDQDLVALADVFTARVVSVVDPGAPMELAAISFYPKDVEDVALAGRRLYVGLSDGSVWAYDVDTGVPVGFVDTKKKVHDLVVSGDYLYVLAPFQLSVVHLDSQCLGVARTVTLDGSPNGAVGRRRLFVGSDVAYATHRRGYTTIDVSNPAAASVIAHENQPQFGWKQIVADEQGRGVAAVSPNQAFDGPHHVSLYDVSDPLVLDAFLTEFETPGVAISVAIHNGLALVADYLQGFHVLAYATAVAPGSGPSVTLQAGSLLGDGQVAAGRLARVSAQATGAAPIRNVEFYVDDQLVATDGAYPFEHHFCVAPSASSIMVRARVSDISGLVTWSDPLTLVAQADPGTPAGPVLVSDENGKLIALDALSGCAGVIGDMGPPMGDIASTPDGQLYALHEFGIALYSVDPDTADATILGLTELSANLNALVSDLSGTLWSAGEDVLATIDRQTGLATQVSTLGGHESAGDLVLSADGASLLLATVDDLLVSIDLETYSTAVIGPLGEGPLIALARTPLGGLVGFDPEGKAYVIDEDTGLATPGPDLYTVNSIAGITGATSVP